MLNSAEPEIFPAHIVKIDPSLTFMSREKSILGLYESKNAEFLDIFVSMSIKNFMLNGGMHLFITL